MPRMVDEGILAVAADRLVAALAPRPLPPHALVVDGRRLGHFDAVRMRRLEAFADVFELQGPDLAFRQRIDSFAARTDAVDRVARTLAAESALTAWRNERFAVVERFGEPPAFLLERAAARYFGIRTFAAHANGLVQHADGTLRMWLARRSPAKAIDPGMLDNLVGGGIPAGEAPQATLAREAREEAGIDAAIAAQASWQSELYIERHLPDGLQRETIFTCDLLLPPDWVPHNQDGEAVAHRQVDLAEAARLVANEHGADALTVDARAVLLDCLVRRTGATQCLSPALRTALRYRRSS
jgi:8-oxo-dGTP pyrophosphatase MutT (NUDIX family)